VATWVEGVPVTAVAMGVSGVIVEGRTSTFVGGRVEVTN